MGVDLLQVTDEFMFYMCNAALRSASKSGWAQLSRKRKWDFLFSLVDTIPGNLYRVY